MKRLLILASMFLQAGGQPVNVPIQNSAFEQSFPVVSSDKCGQYGYTVAGWQQSGVLLFKPVYPNPCGIPVLPDGATTVAIMGNGATLSQDLGVSPAHFQEYQPGYTRYGKYTLTLYLTNRFNGYTGPLYIEIDYGMQELCDRSAWGQAIVDQITLDCPSPGGLIVDQSLPGNGPPQGQKNFVLHLSAPANSGWPLLVTKFSLTFTPSN